MQEHDIHAFIRSSQRSIEEEYNRIQKRATEDPGTAGDQGEENWATLLRQWLPSYFQIVTKGRILTESGYASPQVDVIVLLPSYPKILLDKKLYLAGGVAAAFECKTTLKGEDVRQTVETASKLRQNLPKASGTPYKELNSPIPYGVLAHSHSWKGVNSTPAINIEKSLWLADSEFVKHPIQALDFLCVADLAAWTVCKITYVSPKQPGYAESLAQEHGPHGFASSGYIRHEIGGDRQANFFSPIGVLLSNLYSKLAWTFADMRTLDSYFRKVKVSGTGAGQMRYWDISIYSEAIRERIFNGNLTNAGGPPYGEWHVCY